MRRLAILTALLVALPVSADSDNNIRIKLTGFQEVPVVTTDGKGELEARISRDGLSIAYELSYSGLQGQVRQAHIHVAQKGVNGAIVLWLCGTATNPGPLGTQVCPQSGTVVGTLTAANLQVSVTQQVAEFADVLAAIRAGAAYANVHTDISPGGEIRGQVGSRGGSHNH